MIKPEFPPACENVDTSVRAGRSSVGYKALGAQNCFDQPFEAMPPERAANMIDDAVASLSLEIDADLNPRTSFVPPPGIDATL